TTIKIVMKPKIDLTSLIVVAKKTNEVKKMKNLISRKKASSRACDSRPLLLTTAAFLVNNGNTLLAAGKMTNSNSPDTALHFNTENARAQGASLRALEEGVTDKAKAERGIFSSSSKLPASVSKEATEEMKKMWLKDSQLFDDMLVSNKKYYDALG
ncbi:hypothetical protein GN958_ATG04582, partial [Phytophthora infestans]